MNRPEGAEGLPQVDGKSIPEFMQGVREGRYGATEKRRAKIRIPCLFCGEIAEVDQPIVLVAGLNRWVHEDCYCSLLPPSKAWSSSAREQVQAEKDKESRYLMLEEARKLKESILKGRVEPTDFLQMPFTVGESFCSFCESPILSEDRVVTFQDLPGYVHQSCYMNLYNIAARATVPQNGESEPGTTVAHGSIPRKSNTSIVVRVTRMKKRNAVSTVIPKPAAKPSLPAHNKPEISTRPKVSSQPIIRKPSITSHQPVVKEPSLPVSISIAAIKQAMENQTAQTWLKEDQEKRAKVREQKKRSWVHWQER